MKGKTLRHSKWKTTWTRGRNWKNPTSIWEKQVLRLTGRWACIIMSSWGPVRPGLSRRALNTRPRMKGFTKCLCLSGIRTEALKDERKDKARTRLCGLCPYARGMAGAWVRTARWDGPCGGSSARGRTTQRVCRGGGGDRLWQALLLDHLILILSLLPCYLQTPILLRVMIFSVKNTSQTSLPVIRS